MARKNTSDKTPRGTALDKGKAYLNKMFKTTDPTTYGVVPVDPNIYKRALPHIPTGSLITDYAIGGEPNDYGIAPCPGFPRGRIIQIWGHESSGKCLPADMRIATPHGLLTVGEVFEHQQLTPTCTTRTTESEFPLYNRYGEIERTTHLTHNNRKITYTVRTFSGGSVRSTANHPHLVMSPNGFWVWKHTRSIQPGDYLLAARGVLKNGGGLAQDSVIEGYMAGLVLADGHLGERRVGLSNDDPDIKVFIEKQGPQVFGVEPRNYPNGDSDESRLYHFNSKDSVVAYYEKWGWWPCNSPEKVVGKRVRELDDPTLIAVLQGYFDCECSVEVEKHAIEVTSASLPLLDDIKLLLQLRLGIIGLVREKPVEAYPDNDYWRLTLSGDEARRFIRTVGTRSTRRAAQYESLLCCPHGGGSTNHDSIPHLGGMLRDLYDSSETNSELHRLAADYMGPSPRANLTYDRLDKIRTAFENAGGSGVLLARLREIGEAHYYYDRVEAVEENASEPTFDFAMPETASFNANGFVTHNTTLALTAAAACIANGGTVLFVDYEHELVAGYAKALGVPVEDDSKFLWVQPDTLEDGFKVIKVMILSGVDMIIIDSVGAAAPTSMAVQKIEDIGNAVQPGLIARGWNDFWMANKPLLTRSQASFVALSQMRAVIGATGFQKKTKPQGGNIWKFIAGIRIELARVGTEKLDVHDALVHKKTKRTQIAKIKIKIVKSKLSMSAGHEAEFYIRWGRGIDDVRSLVEIALVHNIVKKAGAWLKWSTPEGVEISGQGKEGFMRNIKADEGLLDALYAAVIPYLSTMTPEDELYDEDAEGDDMFDDPASDIAVAELDKMVQEADQERGQKEAKADGFEPEDNET